MKKTHRTREDWIQIIEQYQHSGLTQEQFCKTNDLALSTFCKWRNQLKLSCSQNPVTDTTFIELSNPLGSSPSTQWDVELELGHGLYLRMRHA